MSSLLCSKSMLPNPAAGKWWKDQLGPFCESDLDRALLDRFVELLLRLEAQWDAESMHQEDDDSGDML